MLAKFVERDYEKIERLVELRKVYAAKLGVVDEQIKHERSLTNEDELVAALESDWESRRLDAGLFCLQVRTLLSHILASY